MSISCKAVGAWIFYHHSSCHCYCTALVKVKWSRYRPSVAQRVGRGIALLFHDCGTRRGWVVSSMHQPHFTPGRDPVPILQEAGWAPGPVWMGGKSRPNRDSIPDSPARSSVAIPTELPGPHTALVTTIKYKGANTVHPFPIFLLIPKQKEYFF